MLLILMRPLDYLHTQEKRRSPCRSIRLSSPSRLRAHRPLPLPPPLRLPPMARPGLSPPPPQISPLPFWIRPSTPVLVLRFRTLSLVSWLVTPASIWSCGPHRRRQHRRTSGGRQTDRTQHLRRAAVGHHSRVHLSRPRRICRRRHPRCRPRVQPQAPPGLSAPTEPATALASRPQCLLICLGGHPLAGGQQCNRRVHVPVQLHIRRADGGPSPL